jgi:hypothetical protein
LHDHLAFVQTIAFPREDFLDTPAEARPHVCFVYFDRSGNSTPATATTGEQEKHRKNSD